MHKNFNFLDLHKNHIATQCICCGNKKLKNSPAILMPFISSRVFGWDPVLIDNSWGLNTIKDGNAYAICKSLYCTICNFLFLDIRFSDSELRNLYSDYRGKKYIDLRNKYEPGYKLRNSQLNEGIKYTGEVENFLKSYLKFPVTILDWGGDTGKNTPYKNNALAFDIYDISEKKPVKGAKFVSKKEAATKKYDLIICSQVLEHVPYPSDLLFDIKKSMSSKTLLYIEVPFEEEVRNAPINSHLRKKHWHEHINFFTLKSLVYLLNNCGLEVVSSKTDAQVVVAKKSVFLIQLACRIKPK